MSPIPSDGLSCLSVSVSVCLSRVHCEKTVYWVWTPFGMVGRLSSRMRQVDEGGEPLTGRGNCGEEYGATNCNQCGLCGVVVQK